ncbi:hypothetical protein LSAT2_023526 [Lamellibrachia satsuma]|nr:hypothetical protein LSAT2_023526 [Lamellibrachia satsuma]
MSVQVLGLLLVSFVVLHGRGIGMCQSANVAARPEIASREAACRLKLNATRRRPTAIRRRPHLPRLLIPGSRWSRKAPTRNTCLQCL